MLFVKLAKPAYYLFGGRQNALIAINFAARLQNIFGMKRKAVWAAIACLVVACASKTEVVVEKFPDGKAKIIRTFNADSSYLEATFYKAGQPEMKGEASKAGKRNGKWDYWYENGELWSTCEYKEGLKHGKSAVYYPNGQVRYSGQYENDKPVGKWVFFEEDGKIATEKEY